MPLEITIFILFLLELCLVLSGLVLYFYVKNKRLTQQPNLKSIKNIDNKSFSLPILKKYFEEQIEKLHLHVNNDTDELKIAVDARIKLLQSECNLLALEEVDYANLLILYKQIFDSVDCVYSSNDSVNSDETENLQELEILDENPLAQPDIPTLQDAVGLTTKQASKEKQTGSEEIGKIRKIVTRLHASVDDMKQYIKNDNINNDTSIFCSNKLEEIEIAHAQLNMCAEALERNNSRLKPVSKNSGSTIDSQQETTFEASPQDKSNDSTVQDLDTPFDVESDESFASVSEDFELDEPDQSLGFEHEGNNESSDFYESIDSDSEETFAYSSDDDEFAGYDELYDSDVEFDMVESPEYEFDEDGQAQFEEATDSTLEDAQEVEFDRDENVQLDSSIEINSDEIKQKDTGIANEPVERKQQQDAAAEEPISETLSTMDDVNAIPPAGDITNKSVLNSQQQQQEKETQEKIELLEVELTSIEKRLDDKTNQLENLQTMETDLSQVDESNSGDDFDRILKEIDNLTELLTSKSEELSKLRVHTNLENEEITAEQKTGT